MKLWVLACLLAVVVFVECGHTFLGTNVHRNLLFHKDAEYSWKIFEERIENVNYTIPYNTRQYTPTIQGILAYDLTKSGASANVTQGGLGYNFVNLRLKSDRSEALHFDIYIYG